MEEIRAREGKRKLVEEEGDGVGYSILEEEEGDGVEYSILEEEEGDGVEYSIPEECLGFGTFIGDDGEEYYETDDDHIRYEDGSKMCIRHQKEYHKQVKESEGFDITLDLTLGTRFGAPIVPRRGQEKDPIFVDLSQKAIEEFNSQHDTNYRFVKIETVNTSCAAGMWCYITFIANDTDDDDPNTSSKTFQALAWWGINGKTEVSFCRFKKPYDLMEGDKKTPDSDDVKASL